MKINEELFDVFMKVVINFFIIFGAASFGFLLSMLIVYLLHLPMGK